MKQYLVTIEFRYMDAPKSDLLSGHENKEITVGVYDNEDDAISNGNKALEAFEARFPLNPHWNTKERFSRNGGCLGNPKYLVSNNTWITTPFDVYAKITVLKYQDVNEAINEVLEAGERYKIYASREE